MSLSFVNKTSDEVKEKIYGIFSEETGLTNFNNEGIVKGVADSVHKCTMLIYDEINTLFRNISLDDATGTYLDLWGILSDELRKSAVKTVRTFTVLTYGSGKLSEGNWIIIDGLGYRFKVLKTVEFEANTSFVVSCEAEFSGTLYNVTGNFNIRTPKVIDGIDTIAFGEITTLGAEEEKDDPYRERIKAKWRSVTENNPKSKYAVITEGVNGVIDCKIIRAPRAAGSVDVVVLLADGVDENLKLVEINEKLENRGVMCRDLFIRTATKKTVDLEVVYTGDVESAVVREFIVNYINSHLIAEKLVIAGSKSGSLYLSLLNTFVFESLSITPNTDIPCESYYVLRAGNIDILKN